MKRITGQEISNEDQLVTELHQLGVTYLSNRATEVSGLLRPPEQILADTIRQPSARVRTSMIALLLLYPSFAEAVPTARTLIYEGHHLSLKIFYTVAVYLQRVYHQELFPLLIEDWQWLPDLFGHEFGISPNISPQDAIRLLGIRHQELTHSFIKMNLCLCQF